ncbi:hypothetical protein BLA29_010761 [Euroglyphus maynei]|uniref:Uncharacterized protein n=1 Tax=Euroglyphus maynei TaxID=6958 RepID=A0A1Y3AVJ0_EURMA|nr:hypothetical protein BLA29_010761 [Euroglyphus maynei]
MSEISDIDNIIDDSQHQSSSTSCDEDALIVPEKAGQFLKHGEFRARLYKFPALTPGLDNFGRCEHDISTIMTIDVLASIRSYCVECHR